VSVLVERTQEALQLAYCDDPLACWFGLLRSPSFHVGCFLASRFRFFAWLLIHCVIGRVCYLVWRRRGAQLLPS